MAVTTSQLDGYFKRVYAESLDSVTPDFAILGKRIPFRRQDKIGDSFRFPVKLTRSQGYTWNGGATAGNAFTLNPAISLVTREANVTGSEFVLREQISYGAVSRSGGKEESFGPVVDEVVLEMAESGAFQREMSLLYGGGNIGEVGVAANPVFTISVASWAAGLWAQMENAEIDCWNAALAIQQNLVGPLVVAGVDPVARTVTLTGDPADLAAIGVGDVFVPRGANTNWFTGLDTILSNVAGTLFGINAATYSLWGGNTYSSGGAALTIGKLQSAMTRATVRGLMEDVTVLVNTWSWTDLLNDLQALRRYANDIGREVETGSNSIKFYGMSGTMEIVPHPMVKAGEAFIVPLKRMLRIGSTDLTFRLPDAGPDRFVRQMTDAAGFEVRCYFDQGLICQSPAKTVKITNIVNVSGP